MLRSTYKRQHLRRLKQLDKEQAEREIARVKTLDQDTIFTNNFEFEATLYEACEKHLDFTFKKFYVENVLSSMWNGYYYATKKRPWYYKIPARYTKDKVDFIVSLPQPEDAA